LNSVCEIFTALSVKKHFMVSVQLISRADPKCWRVISGG